MRILWQMAKGPRVKATIQLQGTMDGPVSSGKPVSRFIFRWVCSSNVCGSKKFEKKNRNETWDGQNFGKSLVHKPHSALQYKRRGEKNVTGDEEDSKSEYSISGFFKFWIGRRIAWYFRIIKAFVSVSVDPVATPRFRILQVTEVSFCKRNARERANFYHASK